MTSPTARSMAALRGQGFVVCKVEHWNLHAKRRMDAFGFIDLLCLGGGRAILGIQATSGANVAARRAKILEDPHVAPKARAWLESGGEIQLHGWSKRGPYGKAKRWSLRIVPITLEDFTASKESVSSI